MKRHSVLDRLTLDMRPIALLVAEGLSTREISERLGLTESLIETTLACFRGRFNDLVGFHVSRDAMAAFLKDALCNDEVPDER